VKHRKTDRHGVATELHKRVEVRSERNVLWSGAPCGGWLHLFEEPAPDESGMYHAPSIPWDASWPPGTVVMVDIVVRPVSIAKKSRKKCHNPWPAHVHDADKERQRRRAARRK
jgi:hypothetical protein